MGLALALGTLANVTQQGIEKCLCVGVDFSFSSCDLSDLPPVEGSRPAHWMMNRRPCRVVPRSKGADWWTSSSTDGGPKAVNRPYHEGQRLDLSRACLTGSLAGCKEGYRGPDSQMAFWGWEEPRHHVSRCCCTNTHTGFLLF